MIKASYTFPPDFLWGTATSAHQVEGDNVLNDWYEWERTPGRIINGHVSGRACEWWDGRWAEDFDHAAETNQNSHRLSIEWSRIEPTLAVWDEAALEQYRTMIAGAKSRGLEPMVTLHHFTLPQWLADRGGWLAEESAGWFERYTRKAVGVLKDLVRLWVTINEPNVLVYSGYVSNEFPPGEKNIRLAPLAIRNLVRAHAAAYHAIHEIDPHALVGVAHQFRGFKPRSMPNPADRWLAQFKSHNFNDLFPQAMVDGRIRFLLSRDRVPEARMTQDFIGLNYYTSEEVAFDLGNPASAFQPGGYPEDKALSPNAFLADWPQGFWDALRWSHSFRLPIYITENGAEDGEDAFRRTYLARHLHQLWRAANFNWRIKGYFHWSLVDNFEWERGWTQRWGLWSIDEKTQVRKKRPSADFFSEICRTNQLSSELVHQFAGQVFDELFPPRGPSELLV
ncbi:MAG: family 1 glycosylhydrolase [Anaerolineales bacterium]